jgi:hypothetical protein
VYLFADGVHFRVRLEDDRLCTLVLIGVRVDGTKELVAVEDGYRESAESWTSVLRDLKRRGMRAPALAIGDGALGFWRQDRKLLSERIQLGDYERGIASLVLGLRDQRRCSAGEQPLSRHANRSGRARTSLCARDEGR